MDIDTIRVVAAGKYRNAIGEDMVPRNVAVEIAQDYLKLREALERVSELAAQEQGGARTYAEIYETAVAALYP